MTRASRPKSIAIVGGGIAGLAAAFRLQELAPDCRWRLFEASGRLGGVLQTVQRDDWRIELSADNFLTRDPWALSLCERLGITDELLPTNAERRGAMVVHRGKPVRVPKGFVLMSAQPVWPTLSSPLLSSAAKLRLLAEPFMPRGRRGGATDESVASFARRRLGDETLRRLVQPLVGGIYTADVERLSMAATLPQFLNQEAEHGSLWRASRRKAATAATQQSGANYALFMAPRLGLQQLVDAIVEELPADALSTNSRIESAMRTSAGSWRIKAEGQADATDFDALLVATPSYTAAKLLRATDGELADQLSQIEYASSSVVCLGVADTQIRRPVGSFGIVVPAAEGRRIVAASFSSYKFPDRAPNGHTLIRVFVGGVLQPALADLADEELVRLVEEELHELIGLEGTPALKRVVRWPRCMPQYHVGHLDRVDQIEARVAGIGALALAGAGYRGVGVPQCIRSGELAAERLLNVAPDR